MSVRILSKRIVIPSLITYGAISSAVFVYILEATSLSTTIAFGGLIFAPYIILTAFYNFAPNPKNCFIAIIISALPNLYIIADIMYFNPDAQGALAILVMPFVQVFIFAVFYGILTLINSAIQKGDT